MSLNKQPEKSIYSSEEMKTELRERYQYTIDFGSLDFPDDAEAIRNTNEYLVSQMEKFDWPEETRFEMPVDRSHLESMLRRYEESVARSINYYRTKGFKLLDIFAGPVNSGKLEVTLREMFGQDSAVVLVNAGLQSLMYQCGKVLVHGVLRETDGEGPEYTEEIAADFLFQIIVEASGGDPRKAQRTELKSHNMMFFAGAIADSVSLFSIAHEIAHITEEPDSNMTVDELELRADSMAMEVIIADYRQYLNSVDGKLSTNQRLYYLCHLLAPLLFLEICFAVSCFKPVNRGKAEVSFRDYPSPLTRRNALIELLTTEGLWPQIENNFVRFNKLTTSALKLMWNEIKLTGRLRSETLNVIETKNGTVSQESIHF